MRLQSSPAFVGAKRESVIQWPNCVHILLMCVVFPHLRSFPSWFDLFVEMRP